MKKEQTRGRAELNAPAARVCFCTEKGGALFQMKHKGAQRRGHQPAVHLPQQPTEPRLP